MEIRKQNQFQWALDHLGIFVLVGLTSLGIARVLEYRQPVMVPYTATAAIDEVSTRLKQNVAPTEKIKLLLALTKVYRSAADYQSAITCAKSALLLIDQSNLSAKAQLTTALGDIMQDQQNFAAATKRYKEALELHRQANDSEAAANDNINLAALEFCKGAYSSEQETNSVFQKCESYLKQAEECLQREKNSSIQQGAQLLRIQNFRRLMLVQTKQFEQLRKQLMQDREHWADNLG